MLSENDFRGLDIGSFGVVLDCCAVGFVYSNAYNEDNS